MITVLGWLIWNWIAFSVEKDTYDDNGKDFPFREYKKRNWDAWVGTAFMCPFLLWVGYRQLSLDPFEVVTGAKLGWNDLYLLCAGVAWEAFVFGFKKAKIYFKKKTSEL
jgi:hypothetical protein